MMFNLNLQLLADDFASPQTPRERKAKQRIDRLTQQAQKLVDVSNDFLRFARAQEIFSIRMVATTLRSPSTTGNITSTTSAFRLGKAAWQ